MAAAPLTATTMRWIGIGLVLGGIAWAGFATLTYVRGRPTMRLGSQTIRTAPDTGRLRLMDAGVAGGSVAFVGVVLVVITAMQHPDRDRSPGGGDD
jgi:hypothetical protein